jgi:hypothetical protein
MMYGLASTRPQQLVDLESTGWVCQPVDAKTWKCSRTLGGMWIVTSVIVWESRQDFLANRQSRFIYVAGGRRESTRAARRVGSLRSGMPLPFRERRCK